MPYPTKKRSRPSRRSVILLIAGVALVLVSGLLLIIRRQPQAVHSSLPETLTEQMTYEIIQAYPHDPAAFTQGLIYLDGGLYESTGLYGESSLRKVDLATGEVLQQIKLSTEVFAEGLTDWDETLVQLTWREGLGFVYNRADFDLLEEFQYETEGWGLTQDGERLIMSDGSSTLFFLDPETFAVTGTVNVSDDGDDVQRLNELEWVQGQVFANIWQTDDIVRIDPVSGEVLGWIDLAGLLPEEARTAETDVLNGIAYDPAEDRLFVTGKKWPQLYAIRLVPVE